MNGLFYLAHLVQTKNDLNRKRRRFWNLAFVKRRFYWEVPRTSNSGSRIACKEVKLPKAYTYESAKQGYKQAKLEMKEMTQQMREVRKEIGARFHWDANGAINSIELDNKRYYKQEITRLAECYLADAILLGDK